MESVTAYSGLSSVLVRLSLSVDEATAMEETLMRSPIRAIELLLEDARPSVTTLGLRANTRRLQVKTDNDAVAARRRPVEQPGQTAV